MITRIHHLNCATMRPVASWGGRLTPATMVAHCLLVERAEGLLLVDTGFGTDDLAHPARLGRAFTALMGTALDPAETARAQVQARGFTCNDVTDIVLTHLDLDHAGGLADFPRARVHVFADELAAAHAPRLNERARYRNVQWAHGPRWVPHRVDGEEWFGLTGIRVLAPEVLLIPLLGHTRGHCGVAVRRPDGGWLLHAGDSYFFAGETQTPPSYRRGLSAFQTLMATDNRRRLANQERLRTLRADHGEQVHVFSAHDADEFAALAAGELPAAR